MPWLFCYPGFDGYQRWAGHQPRYWQRASSFGPSQGALCCAQYGYRRTKACHLPGCAPDMATAPADSAALYAAPVVSRGTERSSAETYPSGTVFYQLPQSIDSTAQVYLSTSDVDYATTIEITARLCYMENCLQYYLICSLKAWIHIPFTSISAIMCPEGRKRSMIGTFCKGYLLDSFQSLEHFLLPGKVNSHRSSTFLVPVSTGISLLQQDSTRWLHSTKRRC